MGYGDRKYTLLVKNETRFFKPITAYLINLRTINLVINVYYKTNLQRFKSLLLDKEVFALHEQVRSRRLADKLFFIRKSKA